MNRATLAFAAALISTVAVPGAVMAQSPSGAPATSMQSDGATLSDAKLDAAATAIIRVNALSKDYQVRLNEAPPDDRVRIADEADAALEKAVADSGLSVEEYNEIVDIAQNDPDVQARILQRLQGMPDEN